MKTDAGCFHYCSFYCIYLTLFLVKFSFILSLCVGSLISGFGSRHRQFVPWLSCLPFTTYRERHSWCGGDCKTPGLPVCPVTGIKVLHLDSHTGAGRTEARWMDNAHSHESGERIYKVFKFTTLFEFFFSVPSFFCLDICCEGHLWFHWEVLDVEASLFLKKNKRVLYKGMLELLSKNAQIIVLCLVMSILH